MVVVPVVVLLALINVVAALWGVDSRAYDARGWFPHNG